MQEWPGGGRKHTQADGRHAVGDLRQDYCDTSQTEVYGRRQTPCDETRRRHASTPPDWVRIPVEREPGDCDDYRSCRQMRVIRCVCVCVCVCVRSGAM